MADPDDLLDGDGDLNDISYDLDCAEEDALLADDNDYTYKTSLVTRHVTFSDNGDLDEDAIELGVEDDLQVPDDTAEEVGVDSSYSVVESSIPTTYNTLVGAEDSDEDEDKRKKERSRFTNERNMGVPTCINTTPTSIPDTLDKVEVKKAGISTATLKCRMRTRGGGVRPVRPVNIHINPHFRAPHHHPHPHHHQPGPPRWDNNYGHAAGYQPPQPYPNQFPPPRARAPPAQVWNVAPQGFSPEPPPYQPPYQDSFYGGGGHHGPPHHGRDGPHHGGGPPHHIREAPHQGPHPGGPMFQPHGPHHDPNFYPDHGYHPPQHQGKWSRDHQAPPQHFPPPPPQGGHHHGYGGGHPPQGFPPRGPPRPPHPQFQQPRHPQPRPPQPRPHLPIQQGSNLRGRLGPPVKREHPDGIVTQKGVKVARIDGAPVQNLVVSVRSNLQTVNTVQGPLTAPVKPLNVRPHLSGRPTSVVLTGGVIHREVRGMSIPMAQQMRHPQLPRPRNPMIRPQHPLQAQRPRHPLQVQRPRQPLQPQRPRHPVQAQRPQNPVVTQPPRPPPKTLFPGAKEEELNAYMKKIEEQKQKRAMILKEKEEKRASSVTTTSPSVVRTVSLTAPDENQAKQLGNEPEMKVVRVKTKDGRIVLRKLPLDRISKMKKLGPNGEPIVEKTVLVNNLSASTTKHQILVMAKKVGSIASIELNQEAKEAKVKFVEAKAAQDFISKFQRKMVDLSMINLTLVAD